MPQFTGVPRKVGQPARPLKVILRENGCIFDKSYFLLYLLERKGIIYHQVAYDLRF